MTQTEPVSFYDSVAELVEQFNKVHATLPPEAFPLILTVPPKEESELMEHPVLIPGFTSGLADMMTPSDPAAYTSNRSLVIEEIELDRKAAIAKRGFNFLFYWIHVRFVDAGRFALLTQQEYEALSASSGK